ncbi:MAG: response regulator [Deltaproteobacteria bacterium]|nr:response regulator [Deltaproteobacteria bacterium]
MPSLMASSRKASSRPSASRPSTRVLVADDDVEILGLVTRHLSSRGFEVHEADDGETALAQARKLKPDLVVLDVMMPGMSGWQVCRSIREDSALEDTAVIMLTGIGERLNEMTSPLYGADASLDKPFEFGELDATIDRVLESRKKA